MLYRIIRRSLKSPVAWVVPNRYIRPKTRHFPERRTVGVAPPIGASSRGRSRASSAPHSALGSALGRGRKVDAVIAALCGVLTRFTDGNVELPALHSVWGSRLTSNDYSELLARFGATASCVR